MTTTENGALTHSTTMDAVLDLFAMGGALRSRDERSIESLFTKAFAEDSKYALKCLFYLRDIRGGQGERRTFRVIMKYMANNHPDKILHLLHLIPIYGRYDDLYIFVDTPLQKNALDHLQNAALGINGVQKDPLVFKWLKSMNTSSKESQRLGKITKEHFNLETKAYRKLLTEGRKLVTGLVEHELSTKRYEDIIYSQIPSQANLKYRKAFFTHDKERYEAYLQSVQKGEVKINAGTLFPADLVKNAREENDKTVDALWKSLPDYVQKDQNAVVVADTSGSMSWTSLPIQPIDVALSLAIYFAERNNGPFKDHFITFSRTPTMQKILGTTLSEKVRNFNVDGWSGNTDLQAVFRLVLDTAVKNRIGQNEMPKTIYIVSDMEFDSCAIGTNFDSITLQYTQYGYELPHIVFWNVNSKQNNVAVTSDTKNTSLVSGYSTSLFKQVMEGKTPVELMKQVLDDKRYELITVPN